jgi:hypothetical protein
MVPQARTPLARIGMMIAAAMKAKRRGQERKQTFATKAP